MIERDRGRLGEVQPTDGEASFGWSNEEIKPKKAVENVNIMKLHGCFNNYRMSTYRKYSIYSIVY